MQAVDQPGDPVDSAAEEARAAERKGDKELYAANLQRLLEEKAQRMEEIEVLQAQKANFEDAFFSDDATNTGKKGGAKHSPSTESWTDRLKSFFS